MVGLEKEEDLLGMDILDLVPPDQIAKSKLIQTAIKEKGGLSTPVTVNFTTIQGRYTEMEIMASTFKLYNKDAVMYIFQDVTERNKSKKDVEERETRYRALFEMSVDAIFLAKDGIITDCNQAALEMFEGKYEDMIGISPAQISPEFQPDGRRSEELIMANIGRMLQGMDVFTEWDHQSFKGNIIKTELAMKSIDLNGQQFIFALVRDITERKIQEEKVLEERNRASLYLDLLGHDIGNMHQGIHASMEMALYMAENPETMKNYVLQSKSMIEKSMQFVKYVKILSNPNAGERTPVKLYDMISSGSKKAKDSFPEIPLVLSLPDDQNLWIHSHHIIEEVFYNIIHNAIKVQKNSKDPIIKVDIRSTDDFVTVVISDHGPGIDDEKKVTLFDRYKSGGSLRFTGLGLSLVGNLMSRYGDGLKVVDRIDGDHTQGSKFIMRFKKAEPVVNGFSS
jgi:PAS domain S-box-containing protein